MTTAKEARTSKTRPSKANRLIAETSPYLLQHAYNPVDWHAWGPEALKKSKSSDKPILLSIGYSACHWCHVMEKESFENKEIAEFMNEHFVPVKVDREERPDLDEIYMKSVQLMTGHGGWPMTVFLTPDLKPFFGGTYYPPEDRHGLPGFKRLLTVLAQTWREQRDKLNTSADELTNYMSLINELEPSESVPDYKVIETCLEKMSKHFDQTYGGFGGAPKFPQTFTLSLAMHYAAPGSPADEEMRETCLEIVRTTLDRMAYGGMNDQIGGGFARYSVDRYWRVPHFEKMLYDNATLSRAYLEGYQLVGRKYWLDVARETLDFVVRELRTEEGAFYSSLDADSEGEEGKFYAWRPEEIVEILGQADGNWLNEVYSVSKIGSFEHGTSVLMLAGSPEALAEKYKITEDALWERLLPLRQKLLAARAGRTRPGRDEKVLTSWNSLMISSFVDGYCVLKDDSYLKVACDAANFILNTLCVKGRLLRTWGKGKAKLNGYLDDYSYFLQALLDLASVDFNPLWLIKAKEIGDTMIKHFWDETAGGFFYTSDDHEVLINRTKSFYDSSTPSGTSVATDTLLRLSEITGVDTYRSKAEQVFKLYAQHGEKAPDQFANLLCSLDRFLSPKTEIVLVADSDRKDWRDFVHLIHSYYLPNSTIIFKDAPSESAKAKEKKKSTKASSWLADSPLLNGRTVIGSKPTVYICNNFTCDKPLTDLAEIAMKLKMLSGQ